MKVKRHKKAKRILNFFQVNFGLRPPYKVLLCGTFVVNCIHEKVNIREQLPKYLGGDVRAVTTQCCVLELEHLASISPELNPSLHVLKGFPIHKCGHDKTEDSGRKAGAKCLKSMLGQDNPSRYVLATNDRDLRRKASRSSAGVPVLYLHGAAPTLEKPAQASLEAADRAVQKRMNPAKKEAGSASPVLDKAKRKHKVKGKNPLSCLKSKKKKALPPPRPPKREEKQAKDGVPSSPAADEDGGDNAGEATKKRKRFRKRKNKKAADCTKPEQALKEGQCESRVSVAFKKQKHSSDESGGDGARKKIKMESDSG